jgi:Mg2+ and Co2+ transporter CorA
VIKKELFISNIEKQNDMDKLTSKFKQAWIDCWDLDEKEIKIVSDILGIDISTVRKLKNGVINPKYSKCFDEGCLFYTDISTPVVEFAGKLRLHPFRIFLKERFLVTLHSKYSLKIVDSTIRTFQTLELEERKPSVILAKLIHEIIDENSGAMFSIRELIDRIENKAMESHNKKSIMHSIFRLKRQLSTFHRLLWAEKELLSDISLGVIPNMKLVSEAQLIINDASDDITRELEFLGYYDNSLDSILNLLNLGSIHSVERVLVYLTIVLVFMTLFLIVLELAGSLIH